MTVPEPWAIAMRRAETAYWVSVCKFLLSQGRRWSLRNAAGISGIDPRTIFRRLKLSLNGTGGVNAGTWLTKAAMHDVDRA